MNTGRITNEDLQWWLGLAANLDWTFAKTYAETAPHHYVVEGRTPGLAHDDVVRAARVIHTFGTPGKYYSLTKIYLVSPYGRYRWWTEDRHFTDATLVNRATTERSYGIQNAPLTLSGLETPFDEVATTWDAEHPDSRGEAQHVKRLIPIEGVVAVWKSPALSSGLAIVDEVSEPTRGSHRGVRVIR